MKKNGFTLIELLAMLVIIGIIMIIAVPNINGMLKNQRLGLLKQDAINMVEAAKMKANKEKMLTKPKNGDCIIFTLNYLDDNDSIKKGPNGGKYERFDSVVVYTREGSKYKYYVRLVENYKGSRTGIHLLDSANIRTLKTRDVGYIEDSINLEQTDTLEDVRSKIWTFGAINFKCTSMSTIKAYYPGEPDEVIDTTSEDGD